MPRWPAAIALIAVGCLWFALPEQLSLGPGWLLLAIVVLLLLPIWFTHSRKLHAWDRTLTLIANGVITLALVSALVFLVKGLPEHRDPPAVLLRAAASLWVTNVLAFALWYWRLDAGGPHARDARTGPIESAFLSPQMLVSSTSTDRSLEWTPHFVDYLFLAFNTSTAFSPTDTAVLARWAKVLTMLQSIISLTIVVLIAARGVGIL